MLIGPNGSGKSNLVEALALLRAAPRDLPLPIRQGGGVKDWLWRDSEDGGFFAEVGVVLAKGRIASRFAVRYSLSFGAEGDAFTVLDEKVENEEPESGSAKPLLYFGYENGRPMLHGPRGYRTFPRSSIDPTQSILSQRRDPDTYPELARLGYLCLLAILLDPNPAPLVVIEEPELGLHPDVLPTLRDLMVEASESTQLLVPTHSTQLVDAMTDPADSVMVCEKRGATTSISYGKGEHSFRLLATLDPGRVRRASPWAERFFAFLARE